MFQIIIIIIIIIIIKWKNRKKIGLRSNSCMCLDGLYISTISYALFSTFGLRNSGTKPIKSPNLSASLHLVWERRKGEHWKTNGGFCFKGNQQSALSASVILEKGLQVIVCGPALPWLRRNRNINGWLSNFVKSMESVQYIWLENSVWSCRHWFSKHESTIYLATCPP